MYYVWNTESAVNSTDFDESLYQRRRLSTDSKSNVIIHYRILEVDLTAQLH